METQRKIRMLLVEDDLDVLECVRSYFIGQGHEVLVACTVDEALSRLEAPLDLAFVDLLLPGGNGRTVIQAIRKRWPATPVVVITASDDLDLRKELLAHGVSLYLFKPITIRDLESFVRPLETLKDDD